MKVLLGYCLGEACFFGEMFFGFRFHLRVKLGKCLVQTEGVFCAKVLVLLASRYQFGDRKQLWAEENGC